MLLAGHCARGKKKKNRGVLLGSDEPTSKPTEGTAARPPGRKVLVMATKPAESTRMSSAGVRPRQHFSRDLLVQGTPALIFVVCGRGTHGLKGASLRTQLLADVGQCLQQAPRGKLPCLLYPRPRWRCTPHEHTGRVCAV